MIHELPMSQAFALSACAAWASGMEPKNGGYIDRAKDRLVSQMNDDEL